MASFLVKFFQNSYSDFFEFFRALRRFFDIRFSFKLLAFIISFVLSIFEFLELLNVFFFFFDFCTNFWHSWNSSYIMNFVPSAVNPAKEWRMGREERLDPSSTIGETGSGLEISYLFLHHWSWESLDRKKSLSKVEDVSTAHLKMFLDSVQ